MTTSLSTLDELARNRMARGLVVVQGAPATLHAAARHIERRVRASGRTSLTVGTTPCDDVWRELVSQLGSDATADPRAVAKAILDEAGSASIILVDCIGSRWGEAVLSEIARLCKERSSESIFFVLTNRLAPPSGASAIVLEGLAGPEDARLWWEAIAAEAARKVPSSLERLESLERWWAIAKETPLDARRTTRRLAAGPLELLARLRLAERSWPSQHVTRLGTVAAMHDLLAEGVICLDARGRLTLKSDADEVHHGDELPADAPIAVDALSVAESLEAEWPEDPWASARAGELYALAGDSARAERAALGAIEDVNDAAARADFWVRWERSLERMPPEDASDRFLRGAEVALRVGSFDHALGFARAAARCHAEVSHRPFDERFEVMLTLGRASARGDIATAVRALERAVEQAANDEQRARAAVELAEVYFATGDLEAAQRWAGLALGNAGNPATKLLARNVEGKLLLAAMSWSEAERHFAADAWEAARMGDVHAELRARLNQGVALLSSGQRDAARALMTKVLEDGWRHGELDAAGFALTNLYTLAWLNHDYEEAIGHAEHAVDVRRSTGNKASLAKASGDLATLRLRVGLVNEAEEAIELARRLCAGAVAPARMAYISLAAAGVHLARNDSQGARAELIAATAGAERSNDTTLKAYCELTAARIALFEDDVVRLDAAIARARELAAGAAPHSYVRAEVALLAAHRTRSAGEDFGAAARAALDLALEVDNWELARDAYVLLYRAAIASGETAVATRHLLAARSLRDRTIATLSARLKQSFLSKPGIVELDSLGRQPEASDGGPSIHAATSSAPSDASISPSARRGFVGHDPAVRALLRAIEKVGPSPTTVLIQGESGTGKELVADALHAASARRKGPLVKVNCAALVEDLLLSELFGHEKGAFTGAAARRRGRFELAEGGTIFLDEIGDISPRTQVALLRVLQDHTIERVGGTTSISVDVRVVCATHRDLRAMIARREFREDLYYRLRGVVLSVPPLRRRMADLPLIAEAILARIAEERRAPIKRLSRDALDSLARWTWPGNVRELENTLRAASLFAEGDLVEPTDLENVDSLNKVEVPPRTTLDASTPSAGPSSEASAAPASAPIASVYAYVRAGVGLLEAKKQLERECIARALADSGGSITRAAGLLGMKRPRLSQLVKQYGLSNEPE